MRRILAGSLMIALALSLPAGAADKNPSRNAPDLTAVRAKIKAKDFNGAINDLYFLTDNYIHADVYNLLGFSHRKIGDYANAKIWYEKALDLDPDHKGAFEYYGELWVETGEPAKARVLLARLVKLCPKGCEEREDLEKALAKKP